MKGRTQKLCRKCIRPRNPGTLEQEDDENLCRERERERDDCGGGRSTMMAVGSARSGGNARAASSWPAEFLYSVNIADAEPNWRALCHSTEQKLIG